MIDQTGTHASDAVQAQPPLVYTVDSFDSGIAFGRHKLPPSQNPHDQYALKIEDEFVAARMRSHYSILKDDKLGELERNLMRLSKQGVLGSSLFYFGVSTDPFLPFEGKFDSSMRFLDMFLRSPPGHLVIQTRSPLIVIAMPVLRKLGKRVSVTLGVESPIEESVARYTPELPRFEERLKTAAALRSFGVEVMLQVSPVLPYGDWRQDAGEFACLLVNNADYVHCKPLLDGSERGGRKGYVSQLAKQLASDRKFFWLRPDACSPLLDQLNGLAPQKLELPRRTISGKQQINIFAA